MASFQVGVARHQAARRTWAVCGMVLVACAIAVLLNVLFGFWAQGDEVAALRKRLSEQEGAAEELRSELEDLRNQALREEGRIALQQRQDESALAKAQRALVEKDRLLEEQGRALANKDAERERKDREWRERVEEKERDRQNTQADLSWFQWQAERGLYSDSLVLRQYLQTHRNLLRSAWEARVAGQRRRGIVTSAGGIDSVINAFASLYVVRNHLKSTLPISITYWGLFGPDNIDNTTQEFFKEHISDLEFIDLSKLPQPSFQRPIEPVNPDGQSIVGYKVKVFGVYSAPFREVIYLDSDCMTLLDPALLYDLDQYRAHGNLFWPDSFQKYAWHWNAGSIYELFKLDNPWAVRNDAANQAETGQFVIDRLLHWEALEWLLFLNSHDEVVYRKIYGDKDTFRAAFALAGKTSAYQQLAHNPAFILTVDNGRLRNKGMVHRLANGTCMFSHRTPLKYSRHRKLLPSLYLTAVPSTAQATHIILDGHDVDRNMMRLITLSTCNYSLMDWLAAQRSCAPDYDPRREGTQQKLPYFELPPKSHLAAAEAVAGAGYALMMKAQPWSKMRWAKA